MWGYGSFQNEICFCYNGEDIMALFDGIFWLWYALIGAVEGFI